MSGRANKTLKRLLVVITVVLSTAYVAAERVFNVSSNAVLWSVAGSKSELEIRLATGDWKEVSQVTVAEMAAAMRERYEEAGLRWQRLRVRRKAGPMGELMQAVFGAEIHVFVIAPSRFEFGVSYKPNFQPSTARERLEEEGLQFAVTANFKEASGAPLGWVWHEGRQTNKAFPNWSGVFFVKDGRPWFGPKSLLDRVPGVMTEGAQVYPSVITDHTKFGYVFNEPDRFFNGPRVTYRSLAGVRQNGEVVFVLSGDGGVMNVKEVTEIAHKLEVQHATLMDGGRALQYSVKTEDGPWHFAAFNTRVRLGREALEMQESPVFIAVRRRPPLIRSGSLSEVNPVPR